MLMTYFVLGSVRKGKVMGKTRDEKKLYLATEKAAKPVDRRGAGPHTVRTRRPRSKFRRRFRVQYEAGIICSVYM